MNKVLLPSTYLGNIAYFREMCNTDSICLEYKENFPKQTFRNRCEILSANGRLNLIIPLQKWRNHTAIDKIIISKDYNWQQLHWKSITSAYRSSPFFEFYEDNFLPYYLEKKYDYLLDFNLDLLNEVINLLNLSIDLSFTSEYQALHEDKKDLRNVFSPKKDNDLSFEPYLQVFSDKIGFANNLSIIDLLFNQGPQTLSYLRKEG